MKRYITAAILAASLIAPATMARADGGYDPVAGSAIAHAALTPLDMLGCNTNLRACNPQGRTRVDKPKHDCDHQS